MSELRVALTLELTPSPFQPATSAALTAAFAPIEEAMLAQEFAARLVPKHLTDAVQASDAVRALEGGDRFESTSNKRPLWDDGADYNWAAEAPCARYYDDVDGLLKELSPGICALGCSECNGSWLRRVKPIYDRLKTGQVRYHCPNASCKWSSAHGSQMAVRRQDFGLDVTETLSREQGDVPVWEVRFP